MSATHGTNQNVVRGLGLLAAASIVVGNMIGQGVFLKSRVMTCKVETPGMVIAVWVVAGILTLAGALTFAELGTMMPRSGGIYVFLRQAYGSIFGYLYGWMYFAIAGSIALTTLAIAFAIFLNVISAGSVDVELFSLGPASWNFTVTGIHLTAIAVIAVMMLINCAPVSLGGRIMTAFSAFKIVLILAVGVGAFLVADGQWTNFALSSVDGSCGGVPAAARGGFAGFGAAMLGALLAYNGWQHVVSLGGEVKEPSKFLPFAIIGGTTIVIALYIFINVAYFYVLTPADVTALPTSSSVATETVVRFLGPLASKLMAVSLLISILGTMQGNIMASSRVLFAMSRDGMFFRALGEVSKKSRVPVKAVLAGSIWAMIMVFFGSYDTLTDFYIFAAWIFYGLVAATVFIFRHTRPHIERPYRTIGYPVVPAMFILVAAWLTANTLMTKPKQSIIGLLLIAVGLPLFWYRQSRGEVAPESLD